MDLEVGKRVKWIGPGATDPPETGTIHSQQTSENGNLYWFIRWDGDESALPYHDESIRKYIEIMSEDEDGLRTSAGSGEEGAR